MENSDILMFSLFVISAIVFLAFLGIAGLFKMHERTPEDTSQQDDTPPPTTNGNFYINDFMGDE